MRHVVVIGGGITGLSCAYRLLKLSDGKYKVTLLEASGRLGGKILTERVRGCEIELGPDSFLTVKPSILELIRELGLESRLIGTNPENSDVFVYIRGKMRKIPDGLMLMAPSKILPFLRSDLFTWKGKFRMALDWFLPAQGLTDESMGQFARRRLGEEALSALVQPVMAGIYAGDADQLSLRSTFPRFIELEQRHGSLIRGLRESVVPKREKGKVTMFMTLRGGLGDLAEALSRAVGSSSVLNSRVNAVARERSGYAISMESGGKIICDAIVIAAPASQSARFLADCCPELAQELSGIPFVSTGTASLLYDSRRWDRTPAGFGFVVAKDEVRTVSAATFSTTKFPGRTSSGVFLIRCFFGGAGRESLLEAGDPVLKDNILSDMRRLLGISASPEDIRLCRWMGANPQYIVGHEDRLRRIESILRGLPGLWLGGASYYGVGIPDCVSSGLEKARTADAFLSSDRETIN